MPSVISGDANVSATEFGYLDGVTSALQTQMNSKLPIAGGKILQIVRATDSTQRSTTSTSYVDANISVTITPQRNDSVILVIWSYAFYNVTSATNATFRITDASNNPLSGAEARNFYVSGGDSGACDTAVGYATPATTSAVTYKGRFVRSGSGGLFINNQANTGQMFAIEVSA